MDAMSIGTDNTQIITSKQDAPNIYDAWCLVYSNNGKPAQYWRHSPSGLPRFYDSESLALIHGGKQIKAAGMRGEIAMRAVKVQIFVARAEDLGATYA